MLALLVIGDQPPYPCRVPRKYWTRQKEISSYSSHLLRFLLVPCASVDTLTEVIG